MMELQGGGTILNIGFQQKVSSKAGQDRAEPSPPILALLFILNREQWRSAAMFPQCNVIC